MPFFPLLVVAAAVPPVAGAAMTAPAPLAPGAVAVEGTVADRRSAWEGGLIVTRTTLHVDRMIRGEAPGVVEVTSLGGRVGDLAQIAGGAPTMPLGPRVAVELAPAGRTWWLAGVLERIEQSGGLAAPGELAIAYVRATNQDSEPPCSGEVRQVFWPIAEVHWTLDEACSADVGVDACEAAAKASFQTWEDVACAYLSFPYDGRMAAAPIGYQRGGQNLNVVKWFESGWPGMSTPMSIQHALTLTTIGCSSGHVLDADILVNGQDLSFTTMPVAGARIADIQNALTHEVGHLAGFAHSPDPESTMFSTAGLDETKKRDLTPDDAQGLCDVYPVGHEPGSDGGCGCNIRGGLPGPRGVALAGLLVAVLLLARSRPRPAPP